MTATTPNTTYPAAPVSSALPDFPSPFQWPKQFTPGTEAHVMAREQSKQFKAFLKPFAQQWADDATRAHKTNKIWVQVDVLPAFLDNFKHLDLSSRFNCTSIFDISVFWFLYFCTSSFQYHLDYLYVPQEH
jgi:hypothetical protein